MIRGKQCGVVSVNLTIDGQNRNRILFGKKNKSLKRILDHRKYIFFVKKKYIELSIGYFGINVNYIWRRKNFWSCVGGRGYDKILIIYYWMLYTQ